MKVISKVVVLSLALLFMAPAVWAQDPVADRLAKIELANIARDQHVQVVEDKVDALNSKMDALASYLTAPRQVAMRPVMAAGGGGIAVAMTSSPSASACGSGGCGSGGMMGSRRMVVRAGCLDSCLFIWDAGGWLIPFRAISGPFLFKEVLMKRFALFLVMMIPASVGGQSPWLPEADQKAIRAMMPEGVPVSDRLKFYRLPQVYQSLIVLNNRPTRQINPVTTHRNPWVFSGGMHHVTSDDWRNVTGLDVPEAQKILVYGRAIETGATAPVTKIFWQYPVGTLAYDVLIRKGTPERIFEVRTQEKTKNGWVDGTSYRPDVTIPDVKPQHWNWEFSNVIFMENQPRTLTMKADVDVRFVPPIKGNVRFSPSTTVINDGGHLIPKDYAGTGMSCSSCHNNTTVGARTGYGEAIRGGDGRFTWHPFASDGNIDMRWPVEIVK